MIALSQAVRPACGGCARRGGPVEFTLPPHLEARVPPEARGLRRDEVRLLVSDRGTDRLHHARFAALPEYLDAGDLLVVNDSATLPAALGATREDGAAVPLHLSTKIPGDLWVVEPRGIEARVDERLGLPAGGSARLLVRYRASARLWIASLDLPEDALDYLAHHGRPIAYPYVRGEWPLAVYQTVYARVPGSAEMPSAGRAFTADVIARAAARGVRLARLTLHAGVASPERDEPPTEEWYQVPAETADAIAAARARGGRIVAVGTTVVRALESAWAPPGQVIASNGWTDLVVSPDRSIRTADMLLTGFHEPRASHLALLEAFAGRPHLERAYRAALQANYLWHEFGDLHLIR
jgi:S-adenosylmethionine:tRNA ribosyltransferase-isomerase